MGRKLALSVSPRRVPYSPGEARVFGLLTGEPQDTETLTGLHYGLFSSPPYHARRVVAGLLASLARKVRENREPFLVASSGRQGPRPSEYWLEVCPRNPRHP